MTAPADTATLTSRQRMTIEALAAGATLDAAAASAKVTPRTLRRWRTLPEFTDALTQARRDAYSAALDLLATVARLAVVALAEVLQDPDAPASRVAAARVVLDQAREHVALGDLVERLDLLEAALAAKGEPRQ